LVENDNIKTKSKKRPGKWVLVTIAVIFALVFLVRITLQTGFFLDYIRGQIETQANAYLNGTLTIGAIKGDLFKDLTIYNVSVFDENDEKVVHIDTIQANYKVWSFFSNIFIVNEISFINPWIFAKQTSEDSWNLLELLPPSDPEGTFEFPMDLNNILIKGGRIDVESSYYLPDTSISVRNLTIDTGISLRNSGFKADLREFSLSVYEGRLSEPIEFDLVAGYDKGRINLDKLVFSTANTLFQAYAELSKDGRKVTLDALLEPLSWRDILAYTDEPVLIQDVRLELGIRGSLDAFELDLGIQAVGLEGVSIALEGGVRPELAITSIKATSGSMNLPYLTGNLDLPRLDSFEIDISGKFLVSDYENATLKAFVEIRGISQDIYQLDYIVFNGELYGQHLDAELDLWLIDQRIRANSAISDVFSDNPKWFAAISGAGINPSVWASDPDLQADINFELEINGVGFEPDVIPWRVSLNLTESTWEQQYFDLVRIKGDVTRTNANVESLVRLIESEIDLNAQITNWQSERPRYTFFTETRRFDLREIVGLEDFPTSINISATGEGAGIDPETMSVTAAVVMDTSLINGTDVDRFQANMKLDKAILVLDETYIRGSIAEGRLDIRHNIKDMQDASNLIDFNLDVRDVSAFAPLIDAEVLSVTGNTRGQYRINREGYPVIDATVMFNDIIVDTISVEQITGRTHIELLDNPIYDLDLRIEGFLMNELSLNDFWLRTEGVVVDSVINGKYRLDVEFVENTGIVTQADYYLRSDSIAVETHSLTLFDDQYRYNLSSSFISTYVNEMVKVEPLTLIGSGDVEILFYLEQYRAEAFRGVFSAKDVDLAILQRIIMNESYFDGNLIGDITFDFDTSTSFIDFSSDVRILDFNYNSFVIDSMQFNITLAEERLRANYTSIRQDEEFLVFDADVPFQLGDPVGFDDAFFREMVSATFRMNPLDLTSEREALRSLGLDGITGIISAEFELDGLAGSPNLVGNAKLIEGRISGVAVDSVTLDWDYHESEKIITTSATVVSAGQRAAQLTGKVPFSIDWRTFQVELTDETEGIDFRLETNKFDLAAFNQFVDRSVIRNIEGRLNGDVQFLGSLAAPDIRGKMQLRRGAINLVEQNVTFRSIESDVQFSRDRIELERFTMTSNGNLTARGLIRMDAFQFQEIDMTVNARNFRASDSRDLQAFVSTNLNLTGTLEAPKVSGSFTLDRGVIFLDNFGERTVEEVQFDGEESTAFQDSDFWKALTMEMKIISNRNFLVRNRTRPEINLQLNGELDLVKSPGDEVQVFGTMGANEGFVTQLGKRFTVERGDLTFSGQPENPEISVRTLYALRQPSDIKIWYIIEGTAEDPQFRYESDPEMELQDIVSYTVFGRPFHSLMAWEQTVSGRSDAAVADAAFDILLDRVEQIASERLGIDMLQIDNTRSSGNSGTTIKAGKYVSDRLFVAILQELGSNVSSQIMIEYMLRRNLELVITGSDSYQSGIDFMWKYDY
jgi:hypothetical protein